MPAINASFSGSAVLVQASSRFSAGIGVITVSGFSALYSVIACLMIGFSNSVLVKTIFMAVLYLEGRKYERVAFL